MTEDMKNEEQYSIPQETKDRLLERAQQYDSAITKKGYVVNIDCNNCGKYSLVTYGEQNDRVPTYCSFCGNTIGLQE